MLAYLLLAYYDNRLYTPLGYSLIIIFYLPIVILMAGLLMACLFWLFVIELRELITRQKEFIYAKTLDNYLTDVLLD